MKHAKEIACTDISHQLDWDGFKVINMFLDTLTDCNFHSERATVEEALEVEYAFKGSEKIVIWCKHN